LVSLFFGVGAAIYLEEMARPSRFTRFIDINIANLAGVPSIIYGILGLAVFVRTFGLGRSVLAGGLTLAVMILPVIIIASREALRTVPQNIRMAAYALGATKWQTVYAHILPSAMSGIMTGLILALSRALGEAAPLILVGGMTYVAFVPEGPLDQYTSLPIQIFNWIGRPQAEFQDLAASGIIVLLILLALTNLVAIFLRTRFERRVRW
jgi:phosphate transport system permease protein